MSAKTSAEVVIDGKVYTLSGYEGEDYLQKVAAYINSKINEFDALDNTRHLPANMKSTLIQLNIADDYFKAKKQIELLDDEVKAKEKELYDLKHELISTQIKLENLEKNNKNMQLELNENAKKIVRLETEMKDRNR